MSDLQLNLNVQTQEAAVRSFATALNSVSNASVSAGNDQDKLSNKIKNTGDSMTDTAFSFNQLTDAYGKIAEYIGKVVDVVGDLIETSSAAIRLNQLFEFRGVDTATIAQLNATKLALFDLGIESGVVTEVLASMSKNMSAEQVEAYSTKLADIAAASGASDKELLKMSQTLSKMNFRKVVEEGSLVEAKDLFPGLESIDEIYEQLAAASGRGINEVKADIKSKKITFADLIDTMGAGTAGKAAEMALKDPARQLQVVKTYIGEIKKSFALTFTGAMGPSFMRLGQSLKALNDPNSGFSKLTGLFAQFMGMRLSGYIDAINESLNAINVMMESLGLTTESTNKQLKEAVSIFDTLKYVLEIPTNILYLWDFTVESIKNGVVALMELTDNIKIIGSHIIGGLITGMKEKWSEIKAYVSEFKQMFVKEFEMKFKIASPSKVMNDDIGEHLAAGTVQPLKTIGTKVNTALDIGLHTMKPSRVFSNFDLSSTGLSMSGQETFSRSDLGSSPTFQMSFVLPFGTSEVTATEYATAVKNEFESLNWNQYRKRLAGWG